MTHFKNVNEYIKFLPAGSTLAEQLQKGKKEEIWKNVGKLTIEIYTQDNIPRIQLTFNKYNSSKNTTYSTQWLIKNGKVADQKSPFAKYDLKSHLEDCSIGKIVNAVKALSGNEQKTLDDEETKTDPINLDVKSASNVDVETLRKEFMLKNVVTNHTTTTTTTSTTTDSTQTYYEKK